MMKRYPGWNWSSIFTGAFFTGGAISLTGCLAIAFSGSRTLAQNLPLVPDGTLGTDSSRVTPTTIKGLPSDQIDGGVIRGNNLFHSFQEFNINEGRGVYFTNPAGIENILSRVTGKNWSIIQGTLGVLGNANLFLLNPNGILFGGQAQLDLQGSFVGTTAHAIGFPGDGEFPSNRSPVDINNPVLAVNPNALFFNKTPAGAIVNQSTVGLKVASNQNLFLIGGDVIFQGGKITAPGGRVVLGGLAEEGVVKIEDYTTDGSNPTLKFPDVSLHFPEHVDQANVSLTNATIDASKAGRRAGSAGDIFMVGDRISVDQSNIVSNGKIGIISLNARDQVSIVNNSQIQTRGFDNSSDNAGLIQIEATEGSVLVDKSSLSTTNPGSGRAGIISINAPDQVSIVNDSGIFSRGNSGNIFIGESDDDSSFSPRTVTINYSTLQANGRGDGIAGNIFIRAHDQITVENYSEVASRSENDSTDDFGFIKLAATEGSVLLDNSTMSTSNLGSGYSGDIRISAADQVSIVNGSSIFSRGNLGNIFIGEPRYNLLTPESVTIDYATLNTTGLGSGIAGSIFIRASDQIVVKNYSEITSQSENDRIDDFGVIKLAATEGSVLLNQSTISTTNSSSGFAGDISISARDEVSILNQSNILSNGYLGQILIGRSDAYDSSFSPRTVKIDDSTVRAESTVDLAGNISIDATDSISISNIPIAQDGRSRFSTNARGNGVIAGDISFQAGNSVSIDNSSITSELDRGITGEAGKIDITADSISLTNNTELRTLIFGQGTAGNISLQTNGGSVSMDNSRIFSTVESTGSGLGGSIEIDTGSLSVSNRSELQTLVRRDGGVGDAGLILIEADDEVSLTNRGRIFSTVELGAIGNAGIILMDVGSLSVESSSDPDNASGLTTSMSGVGNPGYILVEARDDVYLRGNDSGLYSASGSQSINLGDRTGAIFIDARSLFIRDGARVTVENQGSGEAGSIFVTADEDIIMRDQGQIRAIANSDQGGSIFLTSGDFLVLVNGSQVTAEAGQKTNFGEGGNVFINTRYVIAAPFNDNNIDANAFFGDGGNVEVFASRLYDIQKRDQASFQSNDITASSGYGIDGTVGISPLNPDPTQGLANLPANPVDPTTLIAETCAPRRGLTERSKNQFIVTGRGGLPPDPNAAFPGEAGVNDLGTPEGQETNTTNDSNSTNPSSPAPAVSPSPQQPKVDSPNSANPSSSNPAATASTQKPEFVEAQGWVYGENGDIIFTAQSPTVTPNHPVLTPSSTCNAVSKSPQ